jgi:hypothetical protein
MICIVPFLLCRNIRPIGGGSNCWQCTDRAADQESAFDYGSGLPVNARRRLF